MDDREPALDETIQQIAVILATGYLRFRSQAESNKGLASHETPSVHVTGRLTA
jgi:hypothetical protein